MEPAEKSAPVGKPVNLEHANAPQDKPNVPENASIYKLTKTIAELVGKSANRMILLPLLKKLCR